MSSLFTLSHCDLAYRQNPVLRDLNLTINAGEKVAVVGRSGAGKSTLLQHLYRQQREHCALCPQSHGLVAPLSVFHNVFMGRLHRHSTAYNLLNLVYPCAAPRAEIRALLDELELDVTLSKPVQSLSGGQQQRVALARCLYQGARIFIGDEPVSSLDPYQAGRSLELLSRHFSTLVIALHNIEQALTHFARIIALGDGGILLDKATAELSPAELSLVYQVVDDSVAAA